MRLRSALEQNGQARGSCFQRERQRLQISSRSAPGVIAANSGSPPHTGQQPRVQGAKSTWANTSAQRLSNGRIASCTTGSSPVVPSGGSAADGATAVANP